MTFTVRCAGTGTRSGTNSPGCLRFQRLVLERHNAAELDRHLREFRAGRGHMVVDGLHVALDDRAGQTRAGSLPCSWSTTIGSCMDGIVICGSGSGVGQRARSPGWLIERAVRHPSPRGDRAGRAVGLQFALHARAGAGGRRTRRPDGRRIPRNRRSFPAATARPSLGAGGWRTSGGSTARRGSTPPSPRWRSCLREATLTVWGSGDRRYIAGAAGTSQAARGGRAAALRGVCRPRWPRLGIRAGGCGAVPGALE